MRGLSVFWGLLSLNLFSWWHGLTLMCCKQINTPSMHVQFYFSECYTSYGMLYQFRNVIPVSLCDYYSGWAYSHQSGSLVAYNCFFPWNVWTHPCPWKIFVYCVVRGVTDASSAWSRSRLVGFVFQGTRVPGETIEKWLLASCVGLSFLRHYPVISET